jgi:hypothetical protein
MGNKPGNEEKWTATGAASGGAVKGTLYAIIVSSPIATRRAHAVFMG